MTEVSELGSFDILAAPDRHDFGAHDAGEARDRGNADSDRGVERTEAEKDDDAEGEQQDRDRQQDIHQPHDHGFRAASERTGKHAKRGSESKPDPDGRQGSG